ncbi:hypothetical protein B0T22DRAFT_124793 [Podospora appendiculata]|uniref:Acid phosphatase-like protein n=1 Tax=Podospora appendiculata TaxID=314037 RepID=A0AAE0X792_9PEZI|nr:hypothetical protein B0T22DRAFT_124793 [Podospora appendiculata]
MKTGGVIVLIIVLALIAAGVGWVIFTRVRAKRLGLPPPPLSSYIPFRKSSSSASPYGPPQPAPGGIVGWINDRIRLFKNRNARTAAGAYEGHQPSRAGGGRRGFSPLDPDEAWDTRGVGHETEHYGPGGYYEEQELGLAPHHAGDDTSYGGNGGGGGAGGSSYQMNLAGPAEDEQRGRTRSRAPGLDVPGGGGARNPFEDDAEPSNLSLRGVSPRPIDTAAAAVTKPTAAAKEEDNSPTERRSIFRENV